MKYIFIALVLVLAACTEKGKIADQMMEVPNAKWTYDQFAEFPVTINNSAVTYNCYLKLRVQKSYRYRNIYMLYHIRNPSGKVTRQTINFYLTDDLGRPTGRSAGNSIDYVLPIFTNKKMDGAGQFVIALEQNMRDSVVNGVESIGIKMNEGIPVF